MKKFLSLFICAVIIICAGCASDIPSASVVPSLDVTPEPAMETTPEPTVEATPEPVPETERAIVRVLKAPAVLAVLERGYSAELIGEQDEYYIVRAEAGYGLIEKRLAAKDGDEPYEEWTGYAKKNAAFYSRHTLIGSPEKTLGAGDELKVLADLGDCFLVELDGELGYIKTDSVSRDSGKSEKKSGGKKKNTGSSGSASSSSGSSGSSSSGGGNSGGGNSGSSGGESSGGSSGGESSGGSTGVDGGEITLAYMYNDYDGEVCLTSYIVEQNGAANGNIIVIAAEAELLAGFFERGEEVGVISEDNGICLIYADGMEMLMERRFLLLEGDGEYESKTGYAVSGATLFGDYYLSGENTEKLEVNTEITILDEMEDFLIVSLADGRTGYMKSGDVSAERIEVSKKSGSGGKKPNKNQSSGSQSSGGSSSSGSSSNSGGAPSQGGSSNSGGSSSSGGDSGSSSGGGEWTEPVL